jgi:hypothetical protein
MIRCSTFLIAIGLVSSLTCETLFAARFVPVKVRLQGEVILEGSTTDDGRQDADAVWDLLKSLNLEETDAFRKLGVKPDAKVHTLDCSSEKIGLQPIQVDVAFGGVANSRALTIHRLGTESSGKLWRIASEDVDDLFDVRLIKRKDVVGSVEQL